MTRLDRRMVDEGLVPSRAKARALIEAGAVTVDGSSVSKPSVDLQGRIAITKDPCPWVSRAGLKLAHAVETFGLKPNGVAVDVGASTGGFTDVLLAYGAAHVHAIDVGHDQLHPKLTQDKRVTLHQGINARHLPAGLVPPVDWIVADLSFISLEKVLPSVLPLAKSGAYLVLLIKPQFEVGRGHVGKGGVVRDLMQQQAAADRISAFVTRHGWRVMGVIDSPIAGGDGNREYLLAAVNDGSN
ncbi:MAG: TlyA family RNA methyltransferase [Pseudomonadota bacterium]